MLLMTYTPNANGIYEIPIVDFGNRLQDRFGLRVREHSAFGGNSGGHASNSYHNYDEALDITDHRDDVIDGVSWQQRTSNLRDRLRGIGDELLGPGDKGHDEHVHLAVRGGKFRLTEDQFKYFFGDGIGGQRATFGDALPQVADTPGSTADVPSDGPQVQAKERAVAYQAMTKAQMNAEYDRLRSSDPAKAAEEGMKMHKAFFKKP